MSPGHPELHAAAMGSACDWIERSVPSPYLIDGCPFEYEARSRFTKSAVGAAEKIFEKKRRRRLNVYSSPVSTPWNGRRQNKLVDETKKNLASQIDPGKKCRDVVFRFSILLRLKSGATIMTSVIHEEPKFCGRAESPATETQLHIGSENSAEIAQ